MTWKILGRWRRTAAPSGRGSGHGRRELGFEDITEVAWDDVKEVPLDLGKVKAARAIEMKFVRDRKIYKYATKDESWRVMLKAPIRLKWIDTYKGLLYRSRLVATEVRPQVARGDLCRHPAVGGHEGFDRHSGLGQHQGEARRWALLDVD